MRKEFEAKCVKMDVWKRLQRSEFESQFWPLVKPFHSAMDNDSRNFELVKNTLIFAAQSKIYIRGP